MGKTNSYAFKNSKTCPIVIKISSLNLKSFPIVKQNIKISYSENKNLTLT